MKTSKKKNVFLSSSPEISYELRIPKERVAVLIGEKGKIKKEIEAKTKSQLKITGEGEITLVGKDALLLYTAREIIQAIARGFNPETAFLLLQTNYTLEIVNLKVISGKSKKALIRLKGRIIGRKGKARKEIERLTDTHLSIYGKTVSLIGRTEDVFNAKQALTLLLKGSKHSTAYRFLERKRKEKL